MPLVCGLLLLGGLRQICPSASPPHTSHSSSRLSWPGVHPEHTQTLPPGEDTDLAHGPTSQSPQRVSSTDHPAHTPTHPAQRLVQVHNCGKEGRNGKHRGPGTGWGTKEGGSESGTRVPLGIPKQLHVACGTGCASSIQSKAPSGGEVGTLQQETRKVERGRVWGSEREERGQEGKGVCKESGRGERDRGEAGSGAGEVVAIEGSEF